MNNDKSRHDNLYNIAIYLILVCGLILRSYQYVFNRSLWFDEATLALNIVNSSFFELTQPLSYDQGAPIGFLFIQKLFISAFGNTDYVLRAFPFIAGLLSLILIYYVANAYTKGIGKIVAITLFSINSSMIYYASECKQYSSDVMVTLLLLLCADKCIGPDSRPKNIITLILVGCISMWLSHPAFFIISGISLCFIFDIFTMKDQGTRKLFVLTLLIWIVNFVVLYSISFSQLASNSYLVSYWNEYFMPMPPWKNPIWFRHAYSEMYHYLLGLSSRSSIKSVSSLLILVGCATYSIRKRRTAIIIITPLLFTILASGLKKYPFYGRLLLFAVPFIFLYIAEGIEQIRIFIAKKHSFVAFCISLSIAILILHSPASQAIENLKHPDNHEDIRSVLEYVAHHKVSSDVIYVSYSSIPAFRYYLPKFNLQTVKIVEGIASGSNPNDYAADLQQLKGNSRVWFIFSHKGNQGKVISAPLIDEEKYFIFMLNKIGMKLDEIKADKASAYLYSLE